MLASDVLRVSSSVGDYKIMFGFDWTGFQYMEKGTLVDQVVRVTLNSAGNGGAVEMMLEKNAPPIELPAIRVFWMLVQPSVAFGARQNVTRGTSVTPAVNLDFRIANPKIKISIEGRKRGGNAR